MNNKLKIVSLLFFIFLLLFISFVIYSELKNMEVLRNEYPKLPDISYSYRLDSLIAWGINLFLSFLIPFLFLTSNLSQRISLSFGHGKGFFISGLLYGIVFFGLIFLIKLPFNYYSSYFLSHKYGISNQTLIRWLELNIKSFLVNDLAISLLLWVPYYLIYRNPKTWYVKLSIILIPFYIFIYFISPLVIDPIFNKYTSIEDEQLGVKIAGLLTKSRIGDAEIFMVDKSKDTKTMNAYMTGIFNSKRIVIWDTTINNLEEEEVLAITAHEIGHYVKGHIWKGMLLNIVGTFILMFLVHKTSNWIMKASGESFGFRNLYNYASLPLLILVLNAYTFFSNPISSYVSRNMEVAADSYEISLTEDRKSAASAMGKLYVENLGLPRPSNIYRLWYYTHPTLEERLEFYRTSDFEYIP